MQETALRGCIMAIIASLDVFDGVPSTTSFIVGGTLQTHTFSLKLPPLILYLSRV